MRLVDQWALSIQQWGDLGVVPVGPLDKLTPHFSYFFQLGAKILTWESHKHLRLQLLFILGISFSPAYYCVTDQKNAYI